MEEFIPNPHDLSSDNEHKLRSFTHLTHTVAIKALRQPPKALCLRVFTEPVRVFTQNALLSPDCADSIHRKRSTGGTRVSRQTEIAEILRTHGFQSVNSLAKRFAVTTSTIRRDLERLEAMSLIQRTHGGAVPVAPVESPAPVADELHIAEKRAIGQAMADRILDGQIVLLDGGTTTLEVARHLTKRRLTVVTNDLRVAVEIAQRRSAHLVFIGGELLPDVYTMWGPASVMQLSNLRVDVAVFGADTVCDDGLYHTSSYEVELKRLMRSIAKEAFFVADSSKFGREALFKVLEVNDFTAGITDNLLDPLRASQFPIPLIQVGKNRSA
ncbi:DeoR/GlpR family DNA-binding transcription regulator [Cryobacterium sp. PH31-L1]|uniref:DeoR/GlpR family DNA-binding transcription regulator n=1 Tax=Cryobacterium sp. PH31-L1 TaxID=3046199 RepID=UPI0024BB6FFD|nr:DeoR/GlpR family DNA-binding transcription regulator [Cryobacterium sp. PH31-L1]MDJ0379045.1 DeoR/GlpR family DNA-binding transcription regulator [Cryobacterium sp. PH31-L1]